MLSLILMITISKIISKLSEKQLFSFAIVVMFGYFGTITSKTFSQENYHIKKIIDCYSNSKLKMCKNIISYFEIIQLREYNRGNYRCQTSILGAQTELIKKIYFDKRESNNTIISLPFVIKNCKL